jgi:hypothetical protein
MLEFVKIKALSCGDFMHPRKFYHKSKNSWIFLLKVLKLRFQNLQNHDFKFKISID